MANRAREKLPLHKLNLITDNFNFKPITFPHLNNVAGHNLYIHVKEWNVFTVHRNGTLLKQAAHFATTLGIIEVLVH